MCGQSVLGVLSPAGRYSINTRPLIRFSGTRGRLAAPQGSGHNDAVSPQRAAVVVERRQCRAGALLHSHLLPFTAPLTYVCHRRRR